MLSQLPESLHSPEAFAGLFDHTLLKPDATPAMVQVLCDEALLYGFAGVCVNPVYVPLVAKRLAGKGPRVISVVGFPLGAHRTDIKIDETLRAISDGAQEIDMVMNVGFYLGGEKAAAKHDIQAVIRCARGVLVKVILETAYLTPAQIEEVCGWCVEAGASHVKTSTGFGPRGASLDDIKTMVKVTQGTSTKVKASGGIRTLDLALAMAIAGADRIGSSATVEIMKGFHQALQR
jgi:deoxyribose-phosphate aldolase